MCSRYALASKVKYIEKELMADFVRTFIPFFNAHPGGTYPVILDCRPEKIQMAKWGLVPYWSKWGDMNYNYNASVMDIVKNSVYRVPIRKRRCLVPANCYYTWIRTNTAKQPHVVYIKDQRVFTMAGVYDVWQERSTATDRSITSFAIITGLSNKRIGKFQPTMPVVIPPSRRTRYLKEGIPLNEVMRMLNPFESDLFNLYPVSTKVNNPLENSLGVLKPIGQRLYPEYTYQSKDQLRFWKEDSG